MVARAPADAAAKLFVKVALSVRKVGPMRAVEGFTQVSRG
jgi:hypothetical protein